MHLIRHSLLGLSLSLVACGSSESSPAEPGDASVDAYDAADASMADSSTADTFAPDTLDASTPEASPPGPDVKRWECKKTTIAPSPTTQCGEDGWCWWSPSPLGADFSAVWVNGPSDVWAGSRLGALYHWNGASWSRSSSVPSDDGVRAFAKHPTDGVWMLGEKCTVYKPSGAGWAPATPPCSFSGAGDLWVAGANDVWVTAVLEGMGHWDGTAWSTVAVPASPGEYLFSVYGFSKSDIWAVGLPGFVTHFNGTSWSKIASPDPAGNPRLQAVWGAAPDQVWMGGDTNQVYRWNGTAFTAFDLPSSNKAIRSIWGTGVDDVWFGEGASSGEALPAANLFHWDGVAITKVATYPGFTFADIHGDSKSDVWTVGAAGSLAKFDGTSWSSLRTGSLPDDIKAMWGSASNDVWAAATTGTKGAILHFDGTTWSESKHLDHVVTTIWGIAPDDVWAAGAEGVAEHWDGTSWTEVPVEFAISRVWGAAANDVWGLTQHNMLMHWNGTKWSKYADTFRDDAIGGTSTNDVWIASSNHGFELRHWDGSTWSVVYEDKFGVNADDLFAVAHDDVWITTSIHAHHWDGSKMLEYSLVDGGPAALPKRLWGFGPNDVWAGAGRANMHWNGTKWENAPVGLATYPSALWGCAADDLWLGGIAGTLLHRK